MRKLRIAVLALSITATLAAGARPARAADDDFTRNLLIGAIAGAVLGGVVGAIIYLARDNPTPATTTARANPPTWAAIGLAPLPVTDVKKQLAEAPPLPTGLLTF